MFPQATTPRGGRHGLTMQTYTTAEDVRNPVENGVVNKHWGDEADKCRKDCWLVLSTPWSRRWRKSGYRHFHWPVWSSRYLNRSKSDSPGDLKTRRGSDSLYQETLRWYIYGRTYSTQFKSAQRQNIESWMPEHVDKVDHIILDGVFDIDTSHKTTFLGQVCHHIHDIA